MLNSPRLKYCRHTQFPDQHKILLPTENDWAEGTNNNVWMEVPYFKIENG